MQAKQPSRHVIVELERNRSWLVSASRAVQQGYCAWGLPAVTRGAAASPRHRGGCTPADLTKLHGRDHRGTKWP